MAWFDLASWTRRTTVQDNADGANTGKPAINSRGELLISQTLPPRAELTRLGNTWEARMATGSAFTFVAGYPASTGTRAEFILYNGEASGGKTYVIESVWCLGITSMAAAGSIVLLGQIAPAITAPTDDALQLITGRTGKTYAGNARRAVAVTTMTTNRWSVLGNSINGGSGTAQIGLAAYADVWGSWLLKPGDTFGMNAVAGTAAGTAILGITWSEVQLYHG
jgi:hypothetical protein